MFLIPKTPWATVWRIDNCGFHGRIPDRCCQWRERETTTGRCGQTVFDGASVMLTQLEVPVFTNIAASVLESQRVLTVFNAAPAPTEPLPDELWALCDVLCVNEPEALLTGRKVETDSEAEAGGSELLDRGVGAVLLTRGRRGCLLARKEGCVSVCVRCFAEHTGGYHRRRRRVFRRAGAFGRERVDARSCLTRRRRGSWKSTVDKDLRHRADAAETNIASMAAKFDVHLPRPPSEGAAPAPPTPRLPIWVGETAAGAALADTVRWDSRTAVRRWCSRGGHGRPLNRA